MIVVNLYGGPGSGKSTIAASLFAELKWKGINCELVTEYAKDKVWEGSFNILDNQLYIFAKQHHRLFRLKNKVDVIITDSPLLFSLFYGKDMPQCFKELVISSYKNFNNIDIFLERQKEYNPAGRMQSELEAKEIDVYLKDILNENEVEYLNMIADASAIERLVNIVDCAKGALWQVNL